MTSEKNHHEHLEALQQEEDPNDWILEMRESWEKDKKWWMNGIAEMFFGFIIVGMFVGSFTLVIYLIKEALQ